MVLVFHFVFFLVLVFLFFFFYLFVVFVEELVFSLDTFTKLMGKYDRFLGFIFTIPT